MNKDLTVGDPAKVLWKFCLPLFGSIIFQQLYNIADSFVAGKFIGENALAAVGNSYEITLIFIAFAFGCNIGCSVIVSQLFGAKKLGEMKTAVYTTFISSAVVCAALMLAGTLGCDGLLRLINTPENVFADSKLYLDIYILGLPFVFFYNVATGIFSALGDSKTPFIFLAASSTSNIFMDILFVTAFKMGVAGVALATVIAQAVSAILCLWKLARMRDLFDMKWSYMRLSKMHTMNIIKLGVPSGVTQAIMSMAMLVVQSLTNSFGEQFIAANVIVMRVDGFAMLPNFSFGTAMTTYAGQNIGARAHVRVTQGAKQGTLMGLGVSAAITAGILLFGRSLMSIFTNTEALVEMSMNMMRILAVGYIAMAVIQCLSGVMRGAGDTMTPMWISLVMTIIIRVPLAYGLVYLTRSTQFPQGRKECIFVSLLISWLIGAVMTAVCYKRGKWKEKAVS